MAVYTLPPAQVLELDRYLEQMGVHNADVRSRLTKALPYPNEVGPVARMGVRAGASLVPADLLLPANVAAVAAASSGSYALPPCNRSPGTWAAAASTLPLFLVLDANRSLQEVEVSRCSAQMSHLQKFGFLSARARCDAS